MNETVNPVLMVLLFVLRCLIPLAILFGISYLLRRMEWIVESPAQPQGKPASETIPAPAAEPVKPARQRAAARAPSSKKKKSGGKRPSAPKKKKGVIA